MDRQVDIHLSWGDLKSMVNLRNAMVQYEQCHNSQHQALDFV